MAQPATNPKIEELRFRIKSDPKSRLFYPLAEELRKVGQFAEAEQVLRGGLTSHPTYLSAWVSLGRVLREIGNNQGAVESLSKALQLDPGNVVAARLLADAYLALGEKVEAIKKYKLVHALLPSDQDLAAHIQQLDREINPPAVVPLAAPEPEPEPEPQPEPQPEPEVAAAAPAVASPAPAPVEEERPPIEEAPAPAPAAAPTAFSDDFWSQTTDAAPAAAERAAEEQRVEEATADVEPMSVAHASSPFEEPSADFGYGSDAFEVEAPQGMHIARAPLSADVATLWETEEQLPVETAAVTSPEPLIEPPPVISDPADVFAPAETTPFDETKPGPAPDAFATGVFAPMTEPLPEEAPADEPFAMADEPPPAPAPEDFTNTITMADLYARQGLIDDARHIYENILARDPENHAVREKLHALDAPQPAPAPPPEPRPLFHDAPAEAPASSPFAASDDAPAASPFAASDDAPATSPFAMTAAASDAASAAPASRNPKIARLENWLAKVARREVSGV